MTTVVKLALLVLYCSLAQSFKIDYGDDTHMHPDFKDESIEKTNPRNEDSENSEEVGEYWNKQAQDRLLKHLDIGKNVNTAKNVIFFLGDGLSVPTLSVARVYAAQQEGYTNGEEYEMHFEKFPVTGLAKTYCLDYQVPDSACTATAYLGGVKNHYGTTGVDGTVARRDCEASLNPASHVHSIAKWAIDAGKSVGIVTTTRITHASPSGAYAHVADRNWESDGQVAANGHDPTRCRDIAYQLIHEDPGKHFQVILGGGRRMFRSNSMRDEEEGFGSRSDGRNLIREWETEKFGQRKHYRYVWNKYQLKNIDENTEFLLGLFERDHLQYNLEADPETEPTLEEMVESALKVLSKNDEGYFLFVEGGRIDHAHHATTARLALDETKMFSEAVGKAVNMTDSSDTLIIVSSDHAHVMTHNGYPRRGRDVLGPNENNAGDGKPHTIISYANGPGYRKEDNNGRIDVVNNYHTSMQDLTFTYPSLVPLDSETHSGDDVAVFAYGPQQHLFSGLYEQNLIPHLLGYASCLGPGTTLCNTRNGGISIQSQPIFLTMLLTYAIMQAIKRLF